MKCGSRGRGKNFEGSLSVSPTHMRLFSRFSWIFLITRDPRYEAKDWLEERLKREQLLVSVSPSDTFFKHYPRFPIWVKVRSSKLQSGTQWEIRETEHKMLPNLYTGREPPEYIVLSKFSYGGLLAPEAEHSDEARDVKHLLEGRKDYSLAVTFETPTLVRIEGQAINLEWKFSLDLINLRSRALDRYWTEESNGVLITGITGQDVSYLPSSFSAMDTGFTDFFGTRSIETKQGEIGVTPLSTSRPCG